MKGIQIYTTKLSLEDVDPSRFAKIPYYDNYYANARGFIVHIDNGIPRKLRECGSGEYKYVNINNKPKKIHRLVAAAFLGLDLLNPRFVAHHIDRNTLNNNVSNLEVMINVYHVKLHNMMRFKKRKFLRLSDLIDPRYNPQNLEVIYID